jgi:hypothetical protein
VWVETDIVERLDAFCSEEQPRIGAIRYAMVASGDKASILMRNPGGWKLIASKEADLAMQVGASMMTLLNSQTKIHASKI